MRLFAEQALKLLVLFLSDASPQINILMSNAQILDTKKLLSINLTKIQQNYIVDILLRNGGKMPYEAIISELGMFSQPILLLNQISNLLNLVADKDQSSGNFVLRPPESVPLPSLVLFTGHMSHSSKNRLFTNHAFWRNLSEPLDKFLPNLLLNEKLVREHGHLRHTDPVSFKLDALSKMAIQILSQ